MWTLCGGTVQVKLMLPLTNRTERNLCVTETRRLILKTLNLLTLALQFYDVQIIKVSDDNTVNTN